jgi:hypothetical protein
MFDLVGLWRTHFPHLEILLAPVLKIGQKKAMLEQALEQKQALAELLKAVAFLMLWAPAIPAQIQF